MKKKGFTLIELLAVLVILGILITLAVASVSRYLSSGKRTYYRNIEKTVKLSAQDYFDDYRSLLPRKIGDIASVKLSVLVENNYIDPVLDEDNNECNGAVTVLKTGKNRYEYTVCLQCSNKYNSDGLTCEDVDINSNIKQYEIDLNNDLPSSIQQCYSLSVPTATVKETANGLTNVVTANLEGNPKSIDTTILGTSNIKWMYHYKTISSSIDIVDNVKPATPNVLLYTSNGKEYNPRKEDGSINYTNKQLIISVFSEDKACLAGDENCNKNCASLTGSGLDKIEYWLTSSPNIKKSISSNKNRTQTILSETLNGQVNLVVKDKAGNSSDVVTFESYLDMDDPTFEITKAVTTSKSITVPVTQLNDIGSGIDINDITCEYGATTSYGSYGEYKNNSCVFIGKDDTTYYYKVTVKDRAGNKTVKTDSAKTASLGTVSIVPNGTDWVKSRNITFTSTSPDSTLQYKVVYMSDRSKDIDWTNIKSGNSITLSELALISEPTYVYARLTDGTNTLDPITYTETKIDNEEPTASINKYVNTTNTVGIVYNLNDIGSGVNKVLCEYGTTDQYGSTGIVSDSQCSFGGLQTNNNYYFKLTFIDNVGNQSTITGTTTTSNFGTINISATPSVYSKTKTVTITSTNSYDKIQYQIGSTSGEWINYTSPFVVDENTVIYARLNDGNNISGTSSYVITTIYIKAANVTYRNTTVQNALDDLFNNVYK